MHFSRLALDDARRTNKVIALHHFGGCPNSGVRIDRIADQLCIPM